MRSAVTAGLLAPIFLAATLSAQDLSRLLEASERGDTTAIRALLAQGAQVNARGGTGGCRWTKQRSRVTWRL